MSIFVKCRRCRKKISFNNKFYLYIRNDQCFNANVYLRKIAIKFSRLSKIEKVFTIIVYIETKFIIKIIKITSIVVNSIVVAIISIVVFDVDSFKKYWYWLRLSWLKLRQNDYYFIKNRYVKKRLFEYEIRRDFNWQNFLTKTKF